jgi:hypothetical protein
MDRKELIKVAFRPKNIACHIYCVTLNDPLTLKQDPMKCNNFLLWTSLAVFLSLPGAAQNIVLSDSLAANADPQKVKLGGKGFGKMWKMKFGDFAVISSKAGWTTTTTKSNFWNTKTESRTTQKFSFIFADKKDTAIVNAARNVEVQTLNEIQILPHLYWGSNEMVFESNNYSAFINLNRDTSDIWAILMNYQMGNGPRNQAMLTNSKRKIDIFQVSSNKNGEDKRSLPALGYEFIEEGKPLAALQYYGGGLMGLNKNIVWLHRDLDDKMKLVLAAAATAILQVSVEPPE